MHQLPFSFRSSVLRASLTASQSLPGYSNELVFDSSFNRSLSGSRRVQSKQKRKKSQAPPLTGLVNSGYHSDEYSADVSDVDGGVRPATISRNMTWRPSQQHSKSDIENTTADDCSTSSNHPQSSGEVYYWCFFDKNFKKSYCNFRPCSIRNRPSSRINFCYRRIRPRICTKKIYFQVMTRARHQSRCQRPCSTLSRLTRGLSAETRQSVWIRSSVLPLLSGSIDQFTKRTRSKLCKVWCTFCFLSLFIPSI